MSEPGNLKSSGMPTFGAIEIWRVSNGWIIAPPGHDAHYLEYKVARTYLELANIVSDWAKATENAETLIT